MVKQTQQRYVYLLWTKEHAGPLEWVEDHLVGVFSTRKAAEAFSRNHAVVASYVDRETLLKEGAQ